jgi:hypothetical protein
LKELKTLTNKEIGLVILLICLVKTVFLPLLLLMAPWVIRNWNRLGRIIPFQQDMYAGYGVKQSEIFNIRILALLGEDGSVSWEKKSAASFFSIVTYKTSVWQLPDEIKKDTSLLKTLLNYRRLTLRCRTTNSRKSMTP